MCALGDLQDLPQVHVARLRPARRGGWLAGRLAGLVSEMRGNL